MLDERLINLIENLHVPNTYYKDKSVSYQYWFRSLLQKIDSSLIFYNLPDKWDLDFFTLCLWVRGYVAVFESNRKDLEQYGDVLFQPCSSVAGFNFYYQPVNAIVANPMFERTFEIGKDCEMIKLTPDAYYRGGILDIIDFYASKLAELDKGLIMGLKNAKLPVILTANSSSQSATLKKVYDKVMQGESLVIWKDEVDNDEVIPRKNAFEEWSQDFQKTYVVHNLLEDMETILNSFYVEIGLPVAIEKKERIITSEADFASAQSQARISCWLETLRESLANVNRHFGTTFECEVAFNERNNDSSGNGTVSESV